MTVTITQINVGSALRINNDIYVVTGYSHVKPGKGGAFARVKLKNIKTGAVLDRTFRNSDKLEDVPVEEKKMQYLYHSGHDYVFMDSQTFEQVHISEEVLGSDVTKFLKENEDVTAICNNEQILKVDLPLFITAEVTETDPGFRGDTSKAGTKPATIDTGAQVQVPLFVSRGEWIKIDTRSGTYVERVQK